MLKCAMLQTFEALMAIFTAFTFACTLLNLLVSFMSGTCFVTLQGFVALMAIYTAFAFTCTAWSWFIGPTASAKRPSRMLVSHMLLHQCCHIRVQDTIIISQIACCHVLQPNQSLIIYQIAFAASASYSTRQLLHVCKLLPCRALCCEHQQQDATFIIVQSCAQSLRCQLNVTQALAFGLLPIRLQSCLSIVTLHLHCSCLS